MPNAFQIFNISCSGFSHIKKDTVCQDYSLAKQAEDYSIVVVCDGHGGNDYVRSDIGSIKAAQTFEQCFADIDLRESLSAAVNHSQPVSGLIEQFIKSVIANWNIAVSEHFKDFEFSEEELAKVSDKAKKYYKNGEKIQKAYGTTLIAAAVTDKYWFGIQIGDGQLVAVGKNGEFYEPVPVNEDCFLNVTTSICDSESFKEFRYFFSSDIPAAIIICSDGVENSFKNNDKLYNFYRLILKSFCDTDYDIAAAQLKDYLPRLSANGSGDDVSLSIIFNKLMLQSKENHIFID